MDITDYITVDLLFIFFIHYLTRTRKNRGHLSDVKLRFIRFTAV